MRLLFMAIVGIAIGFFISNCFPLMRINVPTNPSGAELLAPGIVAKESDFYLRRLWGKPTEDLPFKQKYLLAFTVGYGQRFNIDAALKKVKYHTFVRMLLNQLLILIILQFSSNFTIMLFHYDGVTTEWKEFEWSKQAIHVSVPKQTKWWYAKRFLHPDIVAPYDYIFIWDEDLDVEHFNAEEYIKLVRKHDLEISQPGLEPNNGLTWQMTKRRGDREVHKETEEKPGWCRDQHLPPCAAFVEIMAPVFSRKAWRCVWHLIQNDLVHGWGLDFALRKCVELMRRLGWWMRSGSSISLFLLLEARARQWVGGRHGKGYESIANMSGDCFKNGLKGQREPSFESTGVTILD
ncbi:uncharacterized protein LOC144716063 isoform X2 [Wolffia australiana]